MCAVGFYCFIKSGFKRRRLAKSRGYTQNPIVFIAVNYILSLLSLSLSLAIGSNEIRMFEYNRSLIKNAVKFKCFQIKFKIRENWNERNQDEKKINFTWKEKEFMIVNNFFWFIFIFLSSSFSPFFFFLAMKCFLLLNISTKTGKSK